MMRIAQVAPLYESVPPRLYGGTERVVSYLTEELVRQGHHVTLFASGDSITSARLWPICPQALRLQAAPARAPLAPLAHHLHMVERVIQNADDFDVVHFHLDYLPFSQIRRQGTAAVTTLHGRLDIPDLYPLFREFDDMHLVSISNAQRKPMPWVDWLATVHHGLPESLYPARLEEGKYLAFLGRISPEKRVDRAIEIAKRVGMPLRIAAKIDPADQEYFDREIRRLLDNPGVEFIGEIGEHEKAEFLGNAAALLFPIDWPEPFGLVMIEAMACGTPVIAFRHGSVPEIIEDGRTGYIVETVEQAAEAAQNIRLIDRRWCRARFEQRFSARQMCRQYVRAYQQVMRATERAAANRRLGFALLPEGLAAEELSTDAIAQE